MINNPAVLTTLPQADPGRVWAYLLEEPRPPVPPAQPPQSRSTQATPAGTVQEAPEPPPPPPAPATPPAQPTNPTPVFTFLANPESLDWSRQANYAKGATALTSVQSLQYYNSEGRSLQIKDLLLETWYEKRSIRPILEQLQSLLVPDPQSQQLCPKVLSFVWGSSIFKPCVLVSIGWKETAWLSGEPASARLDLTLVEIPPADFDPVSRIYREQAATSDEKPATPLTDRQREEARSLATAYLRQNLNQWSPAVQEQVRSGRFRLLTEAETGDVLMTDSAGTRIGRILRYDGRRGATSGEITTIPLADGVKLPDEMQFTTADGANANSASSTTSSAAQ